MMGQWKSWRKAHRMTHAHRRMRQRHINTHNQPLPHTSGSASSQHALYSSRGPFTLGSCSPNKPDNSTADTSSPVAGSVPEGCIRVCRGAATCGSRACSMWRTLCVFVCVFACMCVGVGVCERDLLDKTNVDWCFVQKSTSNGCNSRNTCTIPRAGI